MRLEQGALIRKQRERMINRVCKLESLEKLATDNLASHQTSTYLRQPHCAHSVRRFLLQAIINEIDDLRVITLGLRQPRRLHVRDPHHGLQHNKQHNAAYQSQRLYAWATTIRYDTHARARTHTHTHTHKQTAFLLALLTKTFSLYCNQSKECMLANRHRVLEM